MKDDTLIIGIAGASGSGKTTLAKALKSAFGDQLILLSHDNYYKDQRDLSPEERENINYDEPDALETSLLVHHLEQLREGQAIEQPLYDFSTHTRRADTLHICPRKVIVIEGILIFADEKLRDMMDIRVFVDTPLDLCLIRRIRRDMRERGRSIADILTQYEKTVRPMYHLHVAPSRAHSTILVPNGGKDRTVISMLTAHIQCFLATRERAEGPDTCEKIRKDFDLIKNDLDTIIADLDHLIQEVGDSEET